MIQLYKITQLEPNLVIFEHNYDRKGRISTNINASNLAEMCDLLMKCGRKKIHKSSAKRSFEFDGQLPSSMSGWIFINEENFNLFLSSRGRGLVLQSIYDRGKEENIFMMIAARWQWFLFRLMGFKDSNEARTSSDK